MTAPGDRRPRFSGVSRVFLAILLALALAGVFLVAQAASQTLGWTLIGGAIGVLIALVTQIAADRSADVLTRQLGELRIRSESAEKEWRSANGRIEELGRQNDALQAKADAAAATARQHLEELQQANVRIGELKATADAAAATAREHLEELQQANVRIGELRTDVGAARADAIRAQVTHRSGHNLQAPGSRIHGLSLPGVVDLSGALLDGSSWTGLEMTKASFDGAMLNGVTLGGYLNGSSFKRANLQSATLAVNLPRGNFEEAILRLACFDGSYLRWSIFRGALDTDQTRFVGCDLREADFTDCDLEQTLFWGAFLEGADFRGARLAGTDFRFADLTDCKFGGGRLGMTGGWFDGAVVAGANFSGLDDASTADPPGRKRAKRSGDVDGYRLSDFLRFPGAIADERTSWPSGFDPIKGGVVVRGISSDEEVERQLLLREVERKKYGDCVERPPWTWGK